MTAGITIDFRPSITAYAEAHDLDLSREAADSLAETLAAVVKVDGNSVAFVIGNGRTGDITEALDLYTEGAPRKAKASSAPVGNTATAKAVAKVQEARAAQSKAAAAETAAAGGNPWSAATFNRTRCAIIQNTDPKLAARLRAQAGARP